MWQVVSCTGRLWELLAPAVSERHQTNSWKRDHEWMLEGEARISPLRSHNGGCWRGVQGCWRSARLTHSLPVASAVAAAAAAAARWAGLGRPFL